MCPEEKNFVKLRDLGQDRLEVFLQEALAGHGCGRRAGDGEKDLLASLAIRLEQCQGLFQLASVLLAERSRRGKAASSWVAGQGKVRRQEAQVVALHEVLELRVDFLVHVCRTSASSLTACPLLVGRLDLLQSRRKLKQRTKRKENRTGLEDVVSVLLAHALLYQNGHYNEAQHSLLLRRAPEQ